MNINCRKFFLLTTALAAFTAPAAAQTIVNSPPTVIPFQGGSSYLLGGGDTLNAYEGAQIFATLNIQDATLNLHGANLTQGVNANGGATVNIYDGNISGGAVADFNMGAASTTTMRGGRFSDTIHKHPSASLIIEGVDFELNGIPVPGLASPGDEASVAVPVGTLFTGIFANGSPFTFDSQLGAGDQFAGQITLRWSARPTGSAVVNVPAEPMPAGVLPGQILNVHTGAALPAAMNAARGSVVNLEGGQAGFFELYGAEINVNSGSAGALFGYGGSTVRLNGGTTSQVSVDDNSTIEVNGGTLGTLAVFPNNDIQINGGAIERLRLFQSGSEAFIRGGAVTQQVTFSNGSTLHLLGGSINPTLGIPSGAHLIMGGGTVGQNEYASINAASGAELTIRARQFTLDGQPVLGLNNPGDSIVLADRPDQTLDAILADGSPLKLYVGTVVLPRDAPLRNSISPLSTLTLTLVPEPATLPLAIACVSAFALNRRRFTRESLHTSSR